MHTTLINRLTAVLSAAILTFSVGAAHAAGFSITRFTSPLSPDTGLPTVATFGQGGVAASAKWLAFGNPQDGGGKGSVSLHDAVTGVFVKKIVAPDGAFGDAFGSAVAITGDHIVIGAPLVSDPNNLSHMGKVYVIHAVKGNLVTTARGISAETRLGSSVAAEGDNLVAGGPNFNANSGIALVKNFITGAEHDIGPPTAPANDNNFGLSVGISGRLVIVGAPLWDVQGDTVPGGGAVFVFDRDTGLLLRTLTAFIGDRGGYFGFSLSMQGNRALIGAPLDGTSGAAYLYDVSTGYYVSGFGGINLAAGSHFGNNVALHGGLAYIAAPDFDGIGKVSVFDSYTSQWRADIPFSGAQTGDRIGNTMAVSALGTLIGNPSAASNRAAVIYVRGLSAPLPGDIYASTGSEATGIASANYKSFTSATVSPTGTVNFMATVTPGASTPKGTTKGLWSDLSGDVSLVARTGNLYNAPGNSITDIGIHQSNLHDRILGLLIYKGPNYPGTLGGTFINNLRDDGNNSYGPIYNGSVFGGSTTVSKLISFCQSYDNVYQESAILVNLAIGQGGTTATSDSGIEIQAGNNATCTAHIREGNSIGADTLGQIDRISFNDNHLLLHAAVPGTIGWGIYARNIRTQTNSLVAHRTGTAPIPSSSYSSFISETTTAAINAHPAFLYRAGIKNTAQPKQTEILVKSKSNTDYVVWVKADFTLAGGGLSGTAKNANLLGYWSADNDASLVHTTVSGTGISAANDGCLIYVPDSGPHRLLLREGDSAPGINGAKIGIIQRVDFDAISGDYAALVSLIGAPKGMDQALYTGHTSYDAMTSTASSLTPDLMLQKGTLIDNGLYGDATVTSIALGSPAIDKGAAGMRQASAVTGGTNSTYVSALLTFSDGTTKVVLLIAGSRAI